MNEEKVSAAPVFDTDEDTLDDEEYFPTTPTLTNSEFSDDIHSWKC